MARLLWLCVWAVVAPPPPCFNPLHLHPPPPDPMDEPASDTDSLLCHAGSVASLADSNATLPYTPGHHPDVAGADAAAGPSSPFPFAFDGSWIPHQATGDRSVRRRLDFDHSPLPPDLRTPPPRRLVPAAYTPSPFRWDSPSWASADSAVYDWEEAEEPTEDVAGVPQDETWNFDGIPVDLIGPDFALEIFGLQPPVAPAPTESSSSSGSSTSSSEPASEPTL